MELDWYKSAKIIYKHKNETAKKRFHHYKIVKQSALNKIIQASPEDHPEIE